MPASSVCQITGVVGVLAPLKLDNGSGLLVMTGSLTVQGGLTVGKQAAFGAFNKKEKAPVTILGPVTVRSHGAFYLGNEVPYGRVFATIGGSVNGINASAIVIQNTYIGDAVKVSGGGGDNKLVDALGGPGNNYTDFEDDQVVGPVSEVGYGGIWAGIIRSIIDGSLQFAYNSQKKIDEYDIGSNVIYGSAFCAGNDPAPNVGPSYGAPSIVRGKTFGNQKATCTGLPGGGTGPPPPHHR
jgi:hypothetical protein